MATVTQIREQIRAALADIEGLTVITRAPESPPSVLPALVIGEPTADLAEGDARLGLDTWDFPLLLLVAMGDYRLASEALDAYLTRTGPTSIRQRFADAPHLGLEDGTSAYLTRVEDYGPRDSIDGQRTAGAVLRLTVRTSG